VQANGVADSEVTLVRGGATELRFAGLVAGSYDATLLRTPFDIVAAERGLSVLASADTLGPYLGTSGFVRRSWARKPRGGAGSASCAPTARRCSGWSIPRNRGVARRSSSPTCAT
jgi:hypothetical protein